MQDLIKGQKYKVIATSEPSWYSVGDVVTFVGGGCWPDSFFTGNSGKTRPSYIDNVYYKGCSIHRENIIPYVETPEEKVARLELELQEAKDAIRPNWQNMEVGDTVRVECDVRIVRKEPNDYTGDLPIKVRWENGVENWVTGVIFENLTSK